MFNFRTDLASERRDLYQKANNLENEIDGIESTKEDIDENIKISKSMQSSAPDTFYMNPSDVLNDTMCSKTDPTKYWNLTNNPYTGNLIEVRAN